MNCSFRESGGVEHDTRERGNSRLFDVKCWIMKNKAMKICLDGVNAGESHIFVMKNRQILSRGEVLNSPSSKPST